MISVKICGVLSWSGREINLCRKIGKRFFRGVMINLKFEGGIE